MPFLLFADIGEASSQLVEVKHATASVQEDDTSHLTAETEFQSASQSGPIESTPGPVSEGNTTPESVVQTATHTELERATGLGESLNIQDTASLPTQKTINTANSEEAECQEPRELSPECINSGDQTSPLLNLEDDLGGKDSANILCPETDRSPPDGQESSDDHITETTAVTERENVLPDTPDLDSEQHGFIDKYCHEGIIVETTTATSNVEEAELILPKLPDCGPPVGVPELPDFKDDFEPESFALSKDEQSNSSCAESNIKENDSLIEPILVSESKVEHNKPVDNLIEEFQQDIDPVSSDICVSFEEPPLINSIVEVEEEQVTDKAPVCIDTGDTDDVFLSPQQSPRPTMDGSTPSSTSSRRSSVGSDSGRSYAPPLQVGARRESVVEQIEKKRRESIGTKLKGLQVPSRRQSADVPSRKLSTGGSELPTIPSLGKFPSNLLPKPAIRRSSYQPVMSQPFVARHNIGSFSKDTNDVVLTSSATTSSEKFRRFSSSLPRNTAPPSENNGIDNPQPSYQMPVMKRFSPSPRTGGLDLSKVTRSLDTSKSVSCNGQSENDVPDSAPPALIDSSISTTQVTVNLNKPLASRIEEKVPELPSQPPPPIPTEHVEKDTPLITAVSKPSVNNSSSVDTAKKADVVTKPSPEVIPSIPSQPPPSSPSKHISTTTLSLSLTSPTAPTSNIKPLLSPKKTPPPVAPKPKVRPVSLTKTPETDTPPIPLASTPESQPPVSAFNPTPVLTAPVVETKPEVGAPADDEFSPVLPSAPPPALPSSPPPPPPSQHLELELPDPTPKSTSTLINHNRQKSADSMSEAGSSDELENTFKSEGLEYSPRQPSGKGSVTHSREDLSEGRGSLLSSPDVYTAPLSPTPSDTDSGIDKLEQSRSDLGEYMKIFIKNIY